jgi:rod shape-determining protein MreB and related proteins
VATLLRSLAGRELAVDLGTANSLVFVRGEGIALFEPSVVAVDDRTGAVEAVGAEARQMIGRTPATIRAIRPLRHGVIADFEVTEQMLRYFIRRVGGGRLPFARVVLCVPSGITKVEREAVEEATRGAGARTVYLVEEPIAAAIGAGLPVADPGGSMIVDIGGGTTEVALISLGGIVTSSSIKVGGYEMDEAIVKYMQSSYNLLIGEETAERAKIEAGSAIELEHELEASIAGRDLTSGLLRRAELSSAEIRRALERPIRRIIEAAKSTLEASPPELAADVGDRGIVLAGGGALLRGMDQVLSLETGLHVALAESPLTCVVYGAGQTLDELDALKKAASNRPRGLRQRRRFRAR